MRALLVALVVLGSLVLRTAPVAEAQTYGTGNPGTTPPYAYGFCPPHPLTFAYAQPPNAYTLTTGGATPAPVTYSPLTSEHTLGWWPTMGFHYGYWPTYSPLPAVVPTN